MAAASLVKGLKPLFDRVIVRKLQPTLQTKSGLFLPASAKLLANVAEVLCVGTQAVDASGNSVPFTVKPGDKVILPDYGGVTIMHDENELQIYRESELLSVVTETKK